MFINDIYRNSSRKITMIGMEQASQNLARLLEAPAMLYEPHIEIMGTTDIAMELNAIDSRANSFAVYQDFIGCGVSGEAILLINSPCFEELATIMH